MPVLTGRPEANNDRLPRNGSENPEVEAKKGSLTKEDMRLMMIELTMIEYLIVKVCWFCSIFNFEG
jgi:hypothetical protein